ncbi:MAG TPA: nuclear transport factor 2 family protein [Pyrinomonadaceae bacterium]|nr:nuclear transport factor 2 family protein [Pyrinomonadaceae bacterium]
MFKVACLIFILYVVVPAQSQTHAPRAAKPDKKVQELKELTFNECEAVLENHTAALDRIWADDFLMHSADDKTTPKAGARAYLRTALPQSISGLCEIEYTEIKVSGGKAKMSGRMRVSATALDGTFKPVKYRFGQRLVKRRGSWQVVFLEFGFDTQ